MKQLFKASNLLHLLKSSALMVTALMLFVSCGADDGGGESDPTDLSGTIIFGENNTITVA